MRRQPKNQPKVRVKRPTFTTFWIAALVIGAFFLTLVPSRYDTTETIPYSAFQKALDEGQIAEVLVVDGTKVTGTYKAAGPDGRPRKFETVLVTPELARILTIANVKFAAEPRSGWRDALGWLLPGVLLILLWLWTYGASTPAGGKGLMAVGKSNAKVFVERSISTTFEDVAGVDEAKEELGEIISFLKDSKGYGRLGAHVPKGVLLVGPPGTGKTLLARAVAGEAGVPFLAISGSEFVELFVGVGAARVRDLFDQARRLAPCIIFIDELDALGRARGVAPITGGLDEKEQTLNQLLAELDGFDIRSGIVLLAATNRPEILDPALLRAGRFDRQILVDRPDKMGRIAILRVHVRNVKLDAGVVLEEIAALTTGFSGADLANVVNEAALLATRRKADAVEQKDLLDAIERIVAGLEKKTRVLGAAERRTVAYHELGHALVALALPGSDQVQKVSIIPRGIAALGYTIQRPIADRFLLSRTELINRMAVLLGGRAAESLVFDELSTGAADDLAKATQIARSMALRHGMVWQLGSVSYEDDYESLLGISTAGWHSRSYSEWTATAIDKAVRRLIDSAFVRARAILSSQRAALDHVADVLLAKESLSGEELAELVRHTSTAPVADSAPLPPASACEATA
jgi:cell division protease FtsH